VISLAIVSFDGSDSPDANFERVGNFRYLSGPDRWEWSDAVARMHGYEPGTVTPTTELILAHKHPDDRAAVAEVVEQVLRHGAPFSSRHRIVDAGGREHVVMVVGDTVIGADGEVVGTAGFYVDVTETFEADLQKSVTEVVAEVDKRRASIHQAVGIIRMTYGVSAERAFEVLTWRSQQTNVKLRVIARQFVDRLAGQPLTPQVRVQVDHALLTAHEPAGVDGAAVYD
jgi:PAS domain S-box-containing protein